MIGWPTVAKAPDGSLFIAFSGDRDHHVCPYGKTYLVRGSADGHEWSGAERINNTPLDDRDAGALVLRSGTVLLSWFTSTKFEIRERWGWMPKSITQTWEKAIAAVKAADRLEWLGSWIRRSVDGGATWEDPIRTVVSTPHGPIQLRDGRVLYVGSVYPGAFTQRVLIEESTDDGRSWFVLSELRLPRDADWNLYEPHMCEAGDGRLIVQLRAHPQDDSGDETRRCLWQATSEDGGRTWTRPEQTPIFGFPPHLLRLRDGRLLTTYGRRYPPMGQRACLSRDDGETWDVEHEIIIGREAPHFDLGYPSSVELNDGRILTVYYQADTSVDEIHLDGRPGGKPYLMGTIWELDA
jgi:hypothetical protein